MAGIPSGYGQRNSGGGFLESIGNFFGGLFGGRNRNSSYCYDDEDYEGDGRDTEVDDTYDDDDERDYGESRPRRAAGSRNRERGRGTGLKVTAAFAVVAIVAYGIFAYTMSFWPFGGSDVAYVSEIEFGQMLEARFADQGVSLTGSNIMNAGYLDDSDISARKVQILLGRTAGFLLRDQWNTLSGLGWEERGIAMFELLLGPLSGDTSAMFTTEEAAINVLDRMYQAVNQAKQAAAQ
ncbi:hypothetical protein FWH13_01370 [Candidatus Saccharibacteria bacterium]|nr:hypothetical protein [Candidatus Saccharibacteria bacterium]